MGDSVLTKFGKLLKIIKENGGFKNSIVTLYRMDELKSGKLVGVDEFGNKYYENNYYSLGKNRWIVYSDRYGLDYDASQIPAEWYGWLHYKTDYLPSEDPYRPKYNWMAKHTENMSGTPKEYVPYSTTKSKIHPWIPPKSKSSSTS